MENTGRGSGRTTRQLQRMPNGGLFVVQNEAHARYVRELAEHLGRQDVRVESLAWVLAYRWQGLRWPAAAVDHGVEPTERDAAALDDLWTRIEPT